MDHVLVLTTLPDAESARAIARVLVDGRLAACVTIGAPVDSMYHWQGATETAREVPVTIKTRRDLFDEVADAIRQQHPYELPEILAVPITHGERDYLTWIDASTAR